MCTASRSFTVGRME